METSLSERIKKIREAAGHSYQDAGKLVGISRQAFRKWETGDTENIKLGNLLRFCDKYQVDINELLRGAAKKTTYPEHKAMAVIVANEIPNDEREIIEGYRAAPPEVQAMFLTLARETLKKAGFIKRSDHQ